MSLCEHGRRRRQSDECVAPAYASTGGSATSARTVAAKASIVVVTRGGAARAWSTAAAAVLRARSEPQPVQGVRSQQHLRAREAVERLQGVRRQQHLRARAAPRLAKNAAAAASRCRLRARPAAQRVQECGGNGICEHGRVRSACKECGGGRSAGTAWVVWCAAGLV